MIIRAVSKGNRQKGALKEYEAKPNITEGLTVKDIKESYTVKTNIPTHPDMKDNVNEWVIDYGKGEFPVSMRTLYDYNDKLFRRFITVSISDDVLDGDMTFEVDSSNKRNVCHEIITKTICENP